MDHLHDAKAPESPDEVPWALELRNGVAEGPAYYQVDIRISRYEWGKEFDAGTGAVTLTLVFKEELESDFDGVFTTDSQIVAEAVARNLEGHLLRSLPFRKEDVEDREIAETLL